MWVYLTLFAALAIGLLGQIYLSQQGIIYENQAAAERIFMRLSSMLFNPWLAGVLFFCNLGCYYEYGSLSIAGGGLSHGQRYLCRFHEAGL